MGWLAKRNKDGIKLYAHLVSPAADLIILGTLLGAVPENKVGLVTTGTCGTSGRSWILSLHGLSSAPFGIVEPGYTLPLWMGLR